MSDEGVYRNLSDAAYDFNRVVWPAISEGLGGGYVIPVEMTSMKEWAKQLDLLAGIDLWQVVDNEMGLRGIASRVQWKDSDSYCSTFTIRETGPGGRASNTEWQKRQYALVCRDNGIISPYYTVHAYLWKPKREGSLIAVGVVETSRLIRYVMDSIANTGVRGPGKGANCDGVGRNCNPQDGRIFLYSDWREMRRHGVEVRVVEGKMQMTLIP